MFRPIKFKSIELQPTVLPLLLFAFLFRFAQYLALSYAAALAHELAHAAVAAALGVRIEKIEILPFGVTVKLRGAYVKRPIHEIAIALAGPLCSIALAVLCRRLRFGEFLFAANLAIALMNLVPALPLDGGRVLRAALTERWGYVKAFNFTMKITRLCAAALSVAGAALLVYSKFNFSILLISAFLLVNTFAEQRGGTHIMMNEILRSREKLSRGCAERSGVIAISADEPARKALKLLSYNRYYIVNVVDKNMRSIGTMTETELIEKLVGMGIRTKAGKMVDFSRP
ncbi:MAG: site-2 protease family protein [Clostridiales bacterium]|jgi:stage IV sporulation protein FB|nr:site-2 protease family protein [Clostridiales bacterium]